MIFKILTYLSGFFTGFIFGAIAGQWLMKFVIEWLKVRGGLI